MEIPLIKRTFLSYSPHFAPSSSSITHNFILPIKYLVLLCAFDTCWMIYWLGCFSSFVFHVFLWSLWEMLCRKLWSFGGGLEVSEYLFSWEPMAVIEIVCSIGFKDWSKDRSQQRWVLRKPLEQYKRSMPCEFS